MLTKTVHSAWGSSNKNDCLDIDKKKLPFRSCSICVLMTNKTKGQLQAIIPHWIWKSAFHTYCQTDKDELYKKIEPPQHIWLANNACCVGNFCNVQLSLDSCLPSALYRKSKIGWMHFMMIAQVVMAVKKTIYNAENFTWRNEYKNAGDACFRRRNLPVARPVLQREIAWYWLV